MLFGVAQNRDWKMDQSPEGLIESKDGFHPLGQEQNHKTTHKTHDELRNLLLIERKHDQIQWRAHYIGSVLNH